MITSFTDRLTDCTLLRYIAESHSLYDFQNETSYTVAWWMILRRGLGMKVRSGGEKLLFNALNESNKTNFSYRMEITLFLFPPPPPYFCENVFNGNNCWRLNVVGNGIYIRKKFRGVQKWPRIELFFDDKFWSITIQAFEKVFFEYLEKSIIIIVKQNEWEDDEGKTKIN